MAAIENATQLLVVLHEAIALVDEQRRAELLDIAENGGGRDVARQLRTWRQEVKQNQDASLAAALGRRDQHHECRDFASIVGPSVQRPQRQGDIGALRQNDISAEDLPQVVEEL